MNETIKEFLVGLGFNIDEAGLKNFVSGITTASMRAAALGAAVTAAAGFVMKGIDDVAKDGEKLELLALKFNTTAAAMDDWGDTAEIMGIGSDKAFESIEALSRVVSEAALGIGRGKIVLEKLGIKAKDASGHIRATTDVMDDLKVKMQGMDRGQALNIMEKLGLDPELLRMFNGELGNTAKVGEELSAIDASVGFDFDKNIAESRAYEAQQRDMMIQVRLLQQWFTKLWAKLATDLMPMARAGLKKTADAFENIRKVLQDNGKKIVEALTPILNIILRIGDAFVTFVARTIGVVGNLIGRVVGAFMAMNEASNGWIGYLAIALAAWKTFNLGFLLTPIGAILGIGVAILALYDDFMTWKEGGESLIDWSSWAPGIEAGLGAINSFIGAVTTLSVAIGDLISAFVKLFSGDFAGFFSQMTEFGNGLINTFKGLWDTVSGLGDAASKIGGVVSDIFGGSPSMPSPQARAAVSSGANVNQATTINVSGGANPQATAQAVAAKQKDVNASMTRNVRGAAR